MVTHQNKNTKNAYVDSYNIKLTHGRRRVQKGGIEGELNLQESPSLYKRKRNLIECGDRSLGQKFRRPLPITMTCNPNYDCHGDSSDGKRRAFNCCHIYTKTHILSRNFADGDFIMSRKLLRKRHIQKERREKKRREALRKQQELIRVPIVVRKKTSEQILRHNLKEKRTCTPTNNAEVKEGGLVYTSGSECYCSDFDGDDERNFSKRIAHRSQNVRS